ncbi:MAG: LLM class flavin-dependent oxidoreductase [Acidimicrobiales bacterium]
MRFGIFDQGEQPGGLALGELLESRLTLAERAEDAGFWGYHKSEHHMIPLDHAPSIGIFLAALAQRTNRMRLCSLVHILPFYHPIRLIEEICMLDHLTHGRLEIGFGKGISAPEHKLWGLAADQAAARTEEMLDLLLLALQSTGDFSYQGDFYDLVDVPLELHPMQLPYPPLWRPGTIETAAALGVSTVVAGPTLTAIAAIERYQSLRQDKLSGGHDPTVGVIRKFVIAPTDAEADRIGRRAWSTYSHNLGLLFRRFGYDIPNDPTIGGDYERAKEFDAIVTGSPERIRDHIDELRVSGVVEYVIGSFAFGDLAHDEALRSIDLFGEHIISQ